MNRYLQRIFLIVLFFSCIYANAQSELFHEIVFEKKLIEKNNWELLGEASFKYIYSTPAWRRWGVAVEGSRKIKNFKINGGLNAFYTFNKSIVNFFEFRPNTTIQYIIPVSGNILLRQSLKYEWRFFYTEESSSTRENYRRLRYQIGFDIPLQNKEETSLKIRPMFEWLFVRDPATFERFPNERDYGIMLIKSLKNESKIFLSYKLEKYYEENNQEGIGHSFLIGYSF